MKKLYPLFGFLALVFAVSLISSTVTMPAVGGWYQTLEKPAWTPPDWVFGPVWTLLYVMIALAGWRIWLRLPVSFSSRWRHPALRPYWVQLLLNFLWSLLFFGLQNPLLGAFDIVALLLAIAVCMAVFWRFDRMAAWLMAPYLLWVAYAASLNIGILLLN